MFHFSTIVLNNTLMLSEFYVILMLHLTPVYIYRYRNKYKYRIKYIYKYKYKYINTTGTGVVHQSPGFGADDYNVCLRYNVIDADNPPVPLDANGNYTEMVKDFVGIYVKDADKLIRQHLKKQGRLIQDLTEKHNYPYCWRSDSPLIYKAIHCWFIDVPRLKERLLVNNMKSKWVPSFA